VQGSAADYIVGLVQIVAVVVETAAASASSLNTFQF
jgi:hypothetical protein